MNQMNQVNHSGNFGYWRRWVRGASLLQLSSMALLCAAWVAVPGDAVAKSFQQYQDEASQGNAEAQATLGWMLATGKEVPVDILKAIQWLEKAAAQGHARAQNMLGDLYFSGKKKLQPDTERRSAADLLDGPRKDMDDAKAAEWYRKAAEQGVPEAQASLGMMYYMGVGVPEDEKEAFAWMKRAAEQGLPDAQKNLSVMYAKGQGTPIDKAESARWAQKAQSARPSVQAAAPQSTVAAAAAPSSSPQPQAPSASSAQPAVAAPTAPPTRAAWQAALQALQQKPADLDQLDQVAALAVAVDQVGSTLGAFRKTVAQMGQKPVPERDFAVMAAYNAQISRLAQEKPSALRKQFEKRLAITGPEAERAAAAWGRHMGTAQQLASQGAYGKAAAAAEQAKSTAAEQLGVKHPLTVLAVRDLAILRMRNQQMDLADTLLRSARGMAEEVFGKQDPETLEVHRALSDLYQVQQRFDDAERHALLAWNGYNEGVDKLHGGTLSSGMALARVYQNVGKLQEAETLLVDLCARHSQTFGELHPEHAACWVQAGNLAKQRALYDVSEKRLLKARGLQQAALGEKHPEVWETTVELAGLHRAQGKFREAQTMLATVLPQIAAVKGEERLLYKARDMMAQLHEEQGRFAEAEALMRDVLTYETRTLGKAHPDTLATMTALAGIHRRQDRLDVAEAGYAGALELARKSLGPRHQTTTTIMNNLGLVYEQRGLYDRAEPLFKDAVAVMRETLGLAHPSTWAGMNSLALLYESQGNFDQAAPIYQEIIASATKALGEKHPDTAAFINNLAYLYMLQQSYAQAGPMFEQVLAIWQELLGESHQKTLKAMNNVARVRHYQGKLTDAEPLFRKALELRRTALGAEHADTLRSMQDLAALYHSMKRLDEADVLFRDALAIEERVLGQQHPYTFETLDQYASLKESMGQHDQALSLRQTGFQRRTEFLNRMMWVSGDNAREGYVRLHRPELDRFLQLLTRVKPEQGGRDAIAVGLQRKGLLLKVSSEVKQVSRMSGDPQLLQLTRDLVSARKKLASMTLSGPTAETGDKYLVMMRDLEGTIDDLEGRLGRTSQRFQQTVQSVSVQNLMDYLPGDAVLVDFLNYHEGGRSRLMAGILRKKGSTIQFDRVVYPDSAEAIENAVVAYRAAIQDEDMDEDERQEVGQTVYDMVWAPLAKAIDGYMHVYLVPDGALNILPFSAMVDNDGNYLLQKHDLHLLTSSRDLAPSRAPVAQGTYMTIAGPDYNSDRIASKAVADAKQRRGAVVVREDTRGAHELRDGLRAFSKGIRGLHFDPLPGAEKEGEIIISQAVGSGRKGQLIQKIDAQERVFKEMKTPPEVLHVATHGFFLKADDTLKKRLLKLQQRGAEIQVVPPGDNPMLRAGLAFAGINANAPFFGEIDTDNDGILTALEVLGLNLSGTRLAVLSACETGLGEVHEGEGVYGLRRAFLEAGADNLVVSLWEVSDAGTQALMSSFYKRIASGVPIQTAFRETQLEMLKSPEWNHPYIWSAFMLVGM